MQRMLIDKIGIQEICNIRQPYRPLFRNYRSIFAFLALFLVGNSGFSYFIYLCIAYPLSEPEDDLLIVNILLGSLVILILVLYVMLLLSDPGKIDKTVPIMVPYLKLP
jgi:hypothetical protein